MAKRRLTQKQQRQISANKTQRAGAANTGTCNGTVITHHGKELIVRSDDNQTVNCQLRQNLGVIVCGDRVAFELVDAGSEPKTGVVVALVERRNLLQKSGFGGKAKAVAANIDQVVVVCSLVPKPNSHLTGEISQASKEGRHTTTVSTLYSMPTGGHLVDSPGVRDFSPIDLDREQILNGFVELKPYRGLCKFANCSHSNEPGCAITEALEKGELNAQRVNSFRKMLADSEL